MCVCINNIIVSVVKLVLFMQPCAQLNVMHLEATVPKPNSLNSFTPGKNICIWIHCVDNDMSQVFAFHAGVCVLIILICPALCLNYDVQKKVGGTDSKLTWSVPARPTEEVLLYAMLVFVFVDEAVCAEVCFLITAITDLHPCARSTKKSRSSNNSE